MVLEAYVCLHLGAIYFKSRETKERVDQTKIRQKKKGMQHITEVEIGQSI